MSNTPVDMNALAEEIQKIQHNMRSALSVLQVGAHYMDKSGVDGADASEPMVIKIRQINAACDRLKAISEQLKS